MLRAHAVGLIALATSLSLIGCGDGGTGSDAEYATQTVVKESSPEAQAVRALLNDPATTKDVLTKGKVSSAAAKALLAHRDGADGKLRTADDDVFDTVQEIDEVKGVGVATLKTLVKLATDKGYVAAEKAKKRSVIFSPQPAAQSHSAAIAKLIGQAKTSIDIAMYSYSDTAIGAALADAVKRGVRVRFVFETANEDRKLTGASLAATKSGKLEASGVDVRWVNKIMHHKFMIMDGPRDDAAAAKTATVVSGSANWSSGAATIYDENTLFLEGYPEAALRLQKEFNLLWEHSKDVVSNASLVSETSKLAVTDEMMPLDPGLQIFFTSDNFPVKGTTFSSSSKNTIADQLVAAIDGAEKRIHIASGHMRSRPVAEALIAKAKEHPEVDIVIYLDGQEYVSETGNAMQKADREHCLETATTDSQKRACVDKDYLYGRDVELAGATIRYKYYAYRWDASYAAQMHNKVFIIDDALYTGSYNLSDNAEHNTFENMFRFQGPEFRDLVETYEDHFQDIWETGDGLLAPLRKSVDADPTIPIVFPPMALTWNEVRDLKSLIAAECPAVNSPEFRADAPAHKSCTK